MKEKENIANPKFTSVLHTVFRSLRKSWVEWIQFVVKKIVSGIKFNGRSP